MKVALIIFNPYKALQCLIKLKETMVMMIMETDTKTSSDDD